MRLNTQILERNIAQTDGIGGWLLLFFRFIFVWKHASY